MYVRLLLSLIIVAAAGGCAFRDSGPAIDEARIARRLHKDPVREVLLVRGDLPGTSRVVERVRKSGRVRVLADGVLDAVWGGRALVAVLESGRLVRVEEDGDRKELLQGARKGLAILGDGTVIAVTGKGAETDLMRVDPRGVRRALVPAPGRDGSPLALDDGRVAFVSERDGSPALYVVDPFGGVPKKLTRLTRPARAIQQVDGAVELVDEAGRTVRVPLPGVG